MNGIHKLTVALLTVVAASTWNTTFATSLTMDVESTDSATVSAPISTGTLNKTNAGSLALSSTSNAIGNLDIQGGLVSVSAASNLNGASSAVTFAASGTDPVSHASNTATLEIAGSMNTGAFAFTSDGTVQVDGSNVATLNHAPTGTGLVRKTGAGVMKVASDLGPVATSFNTADGFFESGSNQIAWPSNFTGYVPYGMTDGNPNWYTNDTYDHGLTYGGVTINFGWNPSLGDSDGLIYWAPLGNLTGAHPTVPTPIAGIHVDAGTLYVQSGKAPNAPIQIASGAALQLAGVDESAESQITSALTVQAGGSIEVDANVEVGRALAVTTTYTFDTNDGYYKNGAARIAWPSNFTTFSNDLGGSYPSYSGWNTADTYDHGVYYGGIRLNYYGSTGLTGSPFYFYTDSAMSAVHPTTTVSNGMDAALSGTVLMESGSSIVLGAGSNWARDISVGTAS
jgi:hypothetical protein